VAHLLPPLGAKAFYPLLGVIVKPGPMGSVFYYFQSCNFYASLVLFAEMWEKKIKWLVACSISLQILY
jgi:hypothetical protein